MNPVKNTIIHGAGINDADYPVTKFKNGKQIWQCPFYRAWKNMMQRSCSSAYALKYPAYKDVTVCTEWLTFSNFKTWMQKQNWQGNQLDKDIIIPGNKHYSPDTCCFITPQLNTLLGDCKAARGKQPIGVHIDKGKFRATLRVKGKNKYLGLFPSPELAYKAYAAAKWKLIIAESLNFALPKPVRMGLIAQAYLL